MRILLINQSFYPDQVATAQQLLDLSLQLVDSGHEVTVVCGARAYDNPSKKHVRREVYKDIRIERLSYLGSGKSNFARRMLSGFTFELVLLWKLLWFPRHDVAVYFTSPPLLGVVGSIARLFRRERFVQWLMDLNPDGAIAVGYLRASSWIARILRAVFGYSVRVSDQVIVLDRWMKKKLAAYSVDESKIVVVPPWPAKGLVGSVTPASGKAFRREHGLDSKFVVLYSGNHSIVHPLDTLLAAALELRNDPSIVFMFIGGGYRTMQVTQFAAEHRLENIRQLPHQPRAYLHESLGAADLHMVVLGDAVHGLVHVSKIYGVLAIGKPYLFIGPGASHVGDLLREYPYGFHAENGDVSGVISSIQKARSLSETERAKIHSENINLVRTRYSTEESIGLFIRNVLRQEPSVSEEAAASAAAN